jgi:hypothetical protein
VLGPFSEPLQELAGYLEQLGKDANSFEVVSVEVRQVPGQLLRRIPEIRVTVRLKEVVEPAPSEDSAPSERSADQPDR